MTFWSLIGWMCSRPKLDLYESMSRAAHGHWPAVTAAWGVLHACKSLADALDVMKRLKVSREQRMDAE